MLSQSEFKKIETNYLPIENAFLEKGWILDFKKVSGKVSYKYVSNYNSLVYGITHASKTTGFVLVVRKSRIKWFIVLYII